MMAETARQTRDQKRRTICTPSAVATEGATRPVVCQASLGLDERPIGGSLRACRVENAMSLLLLALALAEVPPEGSAKTYTKAQLESLTSAELAREFLGPEI